MKAVLATTVAMLTLATAAHAVTTVSSTNGPDNTTQTVIFDFNSGAPAGLSGNYEITTGTAADLFRRATW